MTKPMPGKRDKSPEDRPDGIDSELLKLDFGARFVDFGKLADGKAAAEESLVRKLPPKPGRAPVPASHPGRILNLRQRRRDQDS
jgi:hypothetical protein